MTLQPLSAYQGPPYRPKRLAIGALFGVAVAFVGSMFLPWVGVVSAAGAYEQAGGIERANWLVLMAVIVVFVAIRLVREPPGGFIRFVLVALDFFVALGMYIEYIDNLGRAESLTFRHISGRGSSSGWQRARCSSPRAFPSGMPETTEAASAHDGFVER